MNLVAPNGPQLRAKFCGKHEVAATSLFVLDPYGELHVREQSFNTVRPHQVLHYLTPQEIVAQWKKQTKAADCH